MISITMAVTSGISTALRAKGFMWIFGGHLVPPLTRSWGKEGWTGSVGEAFAETARRFTKDARRDIPSVSAYL